MATTINMQKVQKSGVRLARSVARDLGLELDYSIESIKRVEKILGLLCTERRRSGSDEGLHGLAVAFGAYIIEVIERQHGPGTWQRDDPLMGPDTFFYHLGDVAFSPYSWCLKRIYDGKGDDVWV